MCACFAIAYNPITPDRDGKPTVAHGLGISVVTRFWRRRALVRCGATAFRIRPVVLTAAAPEDNPIIPRAGREPSGPEAEPHAPSVHLLASPGLHVHSHTQGAICHDPLAASRSVYPCLCWSALLLDQKTSSTAVVQAQVTMITAGGPQCHSHEAHRHGRHSRVREGIHRATLQKEK